MKTVPAIVTLLVMWVFTDAKRRSFYKDSPVYLRKKGTSFGDLKYKDCKEGMKFGDTWEEPVTGKKNLCWVCTCYSEGKATCSADSLFCPPTDCKKPVRTEGHCCKKCPDKEKTKEEWFKIPEKSKRPTKKPFIFPFRDTNED